MKIAAYEVRRDEQKDFAFIAEKLGVELTEAEDNLTLENHRYGKRGRGRHNTRPHTF